MSADQHMHPRNRYKRKPPNFARLATQYTPLRQLGRISASGKMHLNLHDEETVRTLSEAILRLDFQLNIKVPKNYLVPRIPQRLNYIHVLEDLLSYNDIRDNIIGLDIGTGPSCVYPILALKRNPSWKFLATEIDNDACGWAMANAYKNFTLDQIVISMADEEKFFEKVVAQHPQITFSMCNPPFFETTEVDAKFAQLSDGDPTYTNEIDERPNPPRSRTVARARELGVEGGEVAFVGRMIKESHAYGTKIRIYTSLLGKKSSVEPLKALLKSLGITNTFVWTIGQGRTFRWILAWTYDEKIRFRDFISEPFVSEQEIIDNTSDARTMASSSSHSALKRKPDSSDLFLSPLNKIAKSHEFVDDDLNTVL